MHSVLDQGYKDMELVVSNNASNDDTAQIIDRFSSDSRLVVIEQSTAVSVTDNWNAALAASSGDRITLLGDDDVLLPQYFERADGLLNHHGNPEVLLHNGYRYAFPGSLGSDESYYTDSLYNPDPRLPRDGDLLSGQRRWLVTELFRFAFHIQTNIQSMLVARSALDRLRDGLFKPPFPDFYALGVLLLTVDSWAISSERLVVVGISPKSFGRTASSPAASDVGRSYLGIDPSFPGHLPGSEIMNGHYEVLLTLKHDYPAELVGVAVADDEYVWQQVYAWYVQRRLGSLDTREVLRRLRLLDLRKWTYLARLFVKRIRPGRLLPRLAVVGDNPVVSAWPGMLPVPEAVDIVGFAEWISSGRAAAAARA